MLEYAPYLYLFREKCGFIFCVMGMTMFGFRNSVEQPLTFHDLNFCFHLPVSRFKEAELVLQTPQLILPVGDNQGRMRYILLVTEREREQWRTAIEAQKSHLQIILKDPEIRAEKSSFGAPLTTAVDKTSDALGRAQPYVSGSRVEPSNAELNEVLKLYSQVR